MADGFSVDFSDLDRLAASLGEVPTTAGKRVRQAVQQSAFKVRDSWRESLRGSETLPRGPAAVSFDLKGFQGFGVTIVEAEIGPEVGRGSGHIGGLIGALEFGVGGRQSPTGYGHLALQQNEEDFDKGLSKALEDAEKDAGL